MCWEDGLCGLELSNGLLTRRWTLQDPGFGTVDLIQTKKEGRQATEISMLRAIEAEAKIVLNGTEYRIGDLESTDGFRAYINRTTLKESLRSIPKSGSNNIFRYVTHRISHTLHTPFSWTPGSRHSLKDQPWPPKGVALEVDFILEQDCDAQYLQHPPVVITLHYELYDSIPVMAKWLSIRSTGESDKCRTKYSSDTITIDSVTIELVASYPPYGAYMMDGASPPYQFYDGDSSSDISMPPPLLCAFTDQSYGTKCGWIDDLLTSNDTGTSGKLTSHDFGASEPLLNCNYTHGPNVALAVYNASLLKRIGRKPVSTFTSFRTFLLATDSSDQERQSLMKHRMTQVLLPHTTENPIFFHAIVHNETGFRRVVDQMAEVGFEMLIYSFGSSFQLESADNASYVQEIRRQVDYARCNYNIEVGGYDLICLQRGHGGYGHNIPEKWVRVDERGELSEDACFASGWVDHLNELVFTFLNKTGLSMLETDGPYGGSPCSSKDHTHHNGLGDSVYQQTQLQGGFFRRLRELGVYLNVPDWYFYQGQNRVGMGYNEQQYNLPRWKQLTVSRMGMYDDFYRHLPTQGWMFVPLEEYHGGGEAATFANHPVRTNKGRAPAISIFFFQVSSQLGLSHELLVQEELEWALAQYLGGGTAACYRGHYLYDENTETGERTKAIMKRWIQFYKQHRQTLIQPVVHIRRPTMNSWDGWLHVNPFGDEEVGLAMIFNPTDRHFHEEKIHIPLYYTGMHTEILVRIDDSSLYSETIDRDYSVTVSLEMKPKSIHSIILKRPERHQKQKIQKTV